MAHLVNLRKPKNKVPGVGHRPLVGNSVEEPPKKIEESLVVPAPEPVKTDEAKSAPRFDWEAPSFYYNPQKKYLSLLVMALMAGAAALLFYDRDTLLAIFLMLSSLVLVLYANKRPDMSKISVDQTGISINDRMYYYKELKSFWIDYSPNGPKELSLEAKKWYFPHIKVSLEKEDPLELRSLMINFVPERIHEQSLVDYIARKLGI